MLIESASAKMEGEFGGRESATTFLNSNENELRESAGIFLAKNGSDEAVAELIDAIERETDSLVRKNMIESLRSVTNVAAIPALAKRAQDLSDLALHRVCRNILSAMDDPMAARQLVDILNAEFDRNKMEPIAYAISHLTSDNSVSALIAGAASPNDPVSKACIEGLGNIGTTEALGALFQIIANNENEEHSEIARVVATQSALRAKDGRLVKACVEIIEGQLGERSTKTAIDCLAATHDQAADAALHAQLAGNYDDSTKAYLSAALERRKKLRF